MEIELTSSSYPLEWLFYCIAMAVLGLVIFTSLVRELSNKGPILWPLVGIVPSLYTHLNEIYDWGTKSLIKAGGTFHFKGIWMGGAYGIVTLDPSKVEYILKTNYPNFPKGMYYRERFYDLLGDGIFNSDGEAWKEQRRLAISEMHTRRFTQHSFQTMQDLVHKRLLKLLDRLTISGDHSFDLQELLLRFTFDNICIAALGVDPGCLSIDLPQNPFAEAFEEATELTLLRFLVPPFVWKPMKYFGLGYERRLKEAIKIVQDFAEKTVTERKKELNKFGSLNNHSDILSRILEIRQEYSKHDQKEKVKFYRDFCVSFILAGRDTSSVALAWFFWLVHKTPRVESEILSEINEILRPREIKINEEDGLLFTDEELKKMVYLEAALSESLRLYPSVPIDFKQVLEDDVFPDGTVIKRGSRVFYCIYSMGRVESIWGEDCLEYKPERWINKDGGFVSKSQFVFTVFNGGPRMCAGKKFAYMQMKIIAASMLLRYKIEVVKRHEVVPKLTTTLYMKNGLLVTLKPRLKFNVTTDIA